MRSEQIHITQEKFDALTCEVETLKTAGRREVAENLEYAKSLGDLSENAEYHAARAAQAELEDKIARLERTLKTATVGVFKNTRRSGVGVGSQVKIRREADGVELAYTITGPEEGDVAKGLLAADAPLAHALEGNEAGERVLVKTPRGESAYVIISVS